MNLPRLGRHPRTHESAVGVCHGQTQAAGVHDGVQGGGGPTRAREWEDRTDRGTGTGSDGDGAAELGAASGGRRGPGRAGGADQRGARRAGAPASRDPDAADGARNLKKSGGLLRQGERVRFAFIAAEKASFPVRLLCRVLEVSRAGFYAWQGRAPWGPGRGPAGGGGGRSRPTTDSRHTLPVVGNVLDRQFAQPAPDVAWV